MVHWADVAAGELKEQRGPGPHVFATAITPSGPIHVGNMREVLTTEAIYRAAKDAGMDARLLYIADDYDPLRKVYPFLADNAEGIDYEKVIGRPLREVPCPCGDHGDYSEHFLEPFLRNLTDLGIEPEVLSAYDMYQQGRYVEHTKLALDKQEEIRQIIETVSKRQLPKRWAPFNPQCGKCGTIKGVEVTQYDFPVLLYTCACGHEGQHDITQGGIGKLPWRIDWPARWHFLGVTFEAFGKDHGASGGSWDTGIPLVRQIFGGQEPHHVMYEFLNLKGQGAMHSSTGLAVSAEEVLSMTPPEVMRYLLMRQSPRKHIDFDPGLGLIALVDEFDRFERVYFGKEENPGTFTEVQRTYELSSPHGVPAHLPNKVQFGHLVTVSQMAPDVDGVEAILRRSAELQGDMDEADRAHLAERLDHVRYWLATFAPDQVKFQVQADMADVDLDREAKVFLSGLADRLVDAEWNGKAIHDAIYEAKGEMGPGLAFRAIYRSILGQDRGPRAGFFLASLEREWVIDRFRQAAA